MIRHLRGRAYEPSPFVTPSLYRFVRHPLYVGWILTFWATPTMSIAHLLFASGLTAYILVAIFFEERNLVQFFGADYERYRRAVPALIPFLGRRKSAGRAAATTGIRVAAEEVR